jgi:hypothetical protein
MNDDEFLEEDGNFDEMDSVFTKLTAQPRKKGVLETRRKIERLMELRRLRELDENIVWEDLE